MHNGVYVFCNKFDSSNPVWSWWRRWFWHANVGCTTQHRFGMAFVATACWSLDGVDFVFSVLSGSNGLEGVLKVSHSEFHFNGWGLHLLRHVLNVHVYTSCGKPSTTYNIAYVYFIFHNPISFCVTNPHDKNYITWSILGGRLWWILALRWCTCINACLIYNI